MAYDGSGLSAFSLGIGGKDVWWNYQTTDTFAGTVNVASYFSDGYTRGMRTGQLLYSHKTDSGTGVLAYVSTATAATGVATVTALAFAGAGSFTTGSFSSTLTVTGATTLNGAVAIGDAAADVVGFYGATGSSQRAAAAQATTAVAVSASFGATQLAALQEVMNVLIAAGMMKGSA